MKEFPKNPTHGCETCSYSGYRTELDEFGCTAAILPILCKHGAGTDRSLWPKVDPNHWCNKFEERPYA
jgi:hypothetical protein